MLSALLSTFSGSSFAQAPEPALLIAAASDLAPLEQPLSEALSAETGTPVRFVLGSSGQLAAQIRNGAPYDLYLAASIQYARELEATGHLKSGSVMAYATGRLGLWSKSGKVKALDELSKETVIHVAIPNPAHAPYGMAAKQLLENLGYWPRLKPKLVFAENARQSVQFAERGNADAVITSWSLLFDRPEAVRLPDRYPLLVQGGGVVARSSRGFEATKALIYLRSPAGRALLARFGLFAPPGR